VIDTLDTSPYVPVGDAIEQNGSAPLKNSEIQAPGDPFTIATDALCFVLAGATQERDALLRPDRPGVMTEAEAGRLERTAAAADAVRAAGIALLGRVGWRSVEMRGLEPVGVITWEPVKSLPGTLDT
jgi:hypothetical protein